MNKFLHFSILFFWKKKIRGNYFFVNFWKIYFFFCHSDELQKRFLKKLKQVKAKNLGIYWLKYSIWWRSFNNDMNNVWSASLWRFVDTKSIDTWCKKFGEIRLVWTGWQIIIFQNRGHPYQNIVKTLRTHHPIFWILDTSIMGRVPNYKNIVFNTKVIRQKKLKKINYYKIFL